MKPFKIFLGLLLFVTKTSAFGQTQMDYETSFLYYLKTNNVNLESSPYPFSSSNLSCVWFYSSEFDKNNFENTKNDEFKRNNYYNQLRKTLKTKIDALSFKKEYYILSKSYFGEYNFSDNSFPITSIFTDCHFLNKSNNAQECWYANVPITIGSILNQEYFNYLIKLTPNKAENIINSRKKSGGTVNRSLQTKIIFTFVNVPYIVHPHEIDGVVYNIHENDGFMIYITRIEFYDNGQLIAFIKPTFDFEDPVSGYKVINGEETYSNGTIVVNRVNGIPNGPVKEYNNGRLSRILNCSYYAPGKIIYSGDVVQYTQHSGKMVPTYIQQYKNNKPSGYTIILGQRNKSGYNVQVGDDIIGGVIYLSIISITDENGIKTYIIRPRQGFEANDVVNEIPSEVHELLKKYDYETYWNYPKNGSATNDSNKIINNNAEAGSNKNMATEHSNSLTELNNILISSYNGNNVKDYLARNLEVYPSKKTEAKEKSNVIFLFIYKDGLNENIKPEVKDNIVRQFKAWIEKSINSSSVDLNSLKAESLVKIELMFTARLLGTRELDAFIKTRVYITKNGNLVTDESFEKSKSLLTGNEPNAVIESAIANCEKKIAKILGEYLKIE